MGGFVDSILLGLSATLFSAGIIVAKAIIDGAQAVVGWRLPESITNYLIAIIAQGIYAWMWPFAFWGASAFLGFFGIKTRRSRR